jgi:hypothetical protein
MVADGDPPAVSWSRRIDVEARIAARSSSWIGAEAPPVGAGTCTRPATPHRAVFTALAPLADRARTALATASELDPRGAAAVRIANALAEIERTLVHDPLALADRPVEDVLASPRSAWSSHGVRSSPPCETDGLPRSPSWRRPWLRLLCVSSPPGRRARPES